MTSIKLSVKEWTTIRTALRILRSSPTLRETICGSTSSNEPVTPLTPSEIDDLCDRLYFCAVPLGFVGRGRPTDDAVSFDTPARPLAMAAG